MHTALMAVKIRICATAGSHIKKNEYSDENIRYTIHPIHTGILYSHPSALRRLVIASPLRNDIE
jgi:hypothetical protein